MDRIKIDSIGTFNEGDDGNKYIMVFIDVFSRFVELLAISDLTSLTAARKIVEFTGRYGVSSEILTDNGTQYVNELSNHVYGPMLTNHLTIIPDTPAWRHRLSFTTAHFSRFCGNVR